MEAIIVAVIGTREPDAYQEAVAEDIASFLSRGYGINIATGGALGIDAAAMRGCLLKDLLVYLPWHGYNINVVPRGAIKIVYNPAVHKTWADSVNKYHPAPEHLGRGAFALMARNFGIVEHANLVVALPNEKGTGGTSQGIRIAQDLKIPVIQINKGTQFGASRVGFAQEVLAKLGLK